MKAVVLRKTLLALILSMLLILFVGMAAVPSGADAPSSIAWTVERVDAPKYFEPGGGRSLRLDAAGHPHLTYGADALYHAWHDGATWHLETVDSAPGVGTYASLALDVAGRPHISYYDGTNGRLKYAAWSGAAWAVEIVDAGPGVGYYTSLALDATGAPRISYIGSGGGLNFVLKYARWTGAAWEIQTVDSVGVMVNATSLALDASGAPHISYAESFSDATQGNLKYARWTGTAWATTVVDAIGSYPSAVSSLALDAAGAPHIAYGDGIAGTLKYARWSGAAWGIQTVATIRAPISGSAWNNAEPALALTPAGAPRISYQSSQGYPQISDPGGLKLAQWTGSSWATQFVETSAGGVSLGYNSSLALDATGAPHVSYFELGVRNLKYARRTGTTWAIQVVDRAVMTGLPTSLALDAAGAPHIGYLENGTNILKYAHQNGAGWTIQALTTAIPYWDASVGSVSLALDASGRPHIAYFCNNFDLQYTYWTGAAWTTQTVVKAPIIIGIYGVSLMLDAGGKPHISYVDTFSGSLQYARWTGGAWNSDRVDGAVSQSSLRLDRAGRPHIAYCGRAPSGFGCGEVRHARWTGSAWEIEAVAGVGSGQLEAGADLALDGADRPHISYAYQEGAVSSLKYARWTDAAWVVETADGVSLGVGDSALALDAAGQPHIGYSGDGRLKYAQRTGNGWASETADNPFVGLYASLALDAASRPHISYWDALNGDLKYATGVESLATATPTATATATATPTVTSTPTKTATVTLTPVVTPTATATPTLTGTPVPTATGHRTVTPTPTLTPAADKHIYLPLVLRR